MDKDEVPCRPAHLWSRAAHLLFCDCGLNTAHAGRLMMASSRDDGETLIASWLIVVRCGAAVGSTKASRLYDTQLLSLSMMLQKHNECMHTGQK